MYISSLQWSTHARMLTNETENIIEKQRCKTGFFYDLGNPIMAAKKIKLILSNENLIKEIGLRSKLRQKNLFDSKKMAEEYQKIYKSFI